MVDESDHVDASCLMVSDEGTLSSVGVDLEDRVAESDGPAAKLSVW